MEGTRELITVQDCGVPKGLSEPGGVHEASEVPLSGSQGKGVLIGTLDQYLLEDYF